MRKLTLMFMAVLALTLTITGGANNVFAEDRSADGTVKNNYSDRLLVEKGEQLCPTGQHALVCFRFDDSLADELRPYIGMRVVDHQTVYVTRRLTTPDGKTAEITDQWYMLALSSSNSGGAEIEIFFDYTGYGTNRDNMTTEFRLFKIVLIRGLMNLLDVSLDSA